MEDELLNIIQEVEKDRRENQLVPVHAMFIKDIAPAVISLAKETLNKMVKDKKIVWNRTLNDDAFKSASDEKNIE